MVIGGLLGTGIGGTLAGIVVGWILQKRMVDRKLGDAQTKADRIIEEAQETVEAQINRVTLEAKEEARQQQKRLDREMTRRRVELDRLEQKILKRDGVLDKKLETAEKREQALTQKENRLDQMKRDLQQRAGTLEDQVQEVIRRCEEVSGMTAEQAKQVLLESLETELKQDAAGIIRRVENETREASSKKARQIITLAIQKYAAEQVGESTISVVNLPSDEVKGRIIGREGRNIRTLEAVTGCNFIVDDTPEAVVLSCFDPLRREIARLTLEKLLTDGRIHPGRIEDIFAKTEKEVQDAIRELGEQTAFDLGIHGLHPELVRLVGRLKYRTSYGQNVLGHSIEVASVAKIMAAELNVDSQLAKRAGLLHDIGKAVSYEMEGTHANIGAELAKKYGETPAIVHAIAAHHAEEEPRTIVAVLVQAADAISAARPGARRETLETYIKRLKNLEAIADSFDGVSKAYAIQAGREIRILVDPDKVDDTMAASLARDITKKVEAELEYPGQIKVTVLREVRSVEYAK
ncbi:MAG TPA: ribonuclease Y [Candidatus Sumerlaeota bacterium]|nr:ribonuclease Y [Candidatus Sumerlaeota bacterium]HPS02690.1 ribonuclease Y [Candidatus Sumerlaeota bacterium]